WCCHAGCGGGSVRRLIESRDSWVPVANGYENPRVTFDVRSIISENAPTADDIDFWRRRLLREPDAMRWLREKRGLQMSTARKARLGFDGINFKIPVYGPGMELWN